MRILRQFSVCFVAISLNFIPVSPVVAAGTAVQDPGARVRGGNGCTIVRKVTVFSPVNPGTPATYPDDTLATLERREGGQWVPLASTPIYADGSFEFVSLVPGQYRVCATAPEGVGGACFAGTETSPITLPARSGAPVTASCGLTAATSIQIAVRAGPATLSGDCTGCGKSSTTSKNNAR